MNVLSDKVRPLIQLSGDIEINDIIFRNITFKGFEELVLIRFSKENTEVILNDMIFELNHINSLSLIII